MRLLRGEKEPEIEDSPEPEGQQNSTIPKVTLHKTLHRWTIGDTEFSQSSATDLNILRGVEHIQDIYPKDSFLLQSIEEAALFRACRVPDQETIAELFQYPTRTSIIYFLHRGEVMIAIDDIADPEKNIVYALAHGKLGSSTERHTNNHDYLIYERSKSLIQEHLERAKRRTFKHPSNIASILSFNLNGEYQKDVIVKTILGKSTDVHAEYLKSKNSPVGLITLIDAPSVKKFIDDDHVLVRPCGLGGTNAYNIAVIMGYYRGDTGAVRSEERRVGK